MADIYEMPYVQERNGDTDMKKDIPQIARYVQVRVRTIWILAVASVLIVTGIVVLVYLTTSGNIENKIVLPDSTSVSEKDTVTSKSVDGEDQTTVTTTTESDSTRTQCPDGWMVYGGSCYLFSRETVDFNEAVQICRHNVAHLVHIDGSEENKFLQTVARSLKAARYWIGLTDGETEGIWRWFDDKSLARFTDWEPSQPNGLTGSNCGILWADKDFAWADEPCINRKYRPICEKNITRVPCPDGWMVFEDSCYLFSRENVHFTEAESFCRQRGVHLIQAETYAENAFIKTALRDLKGADYWLGLTDQIVDGIWRWYNTDIVTNFTDWYPKEPNQGIVADCVTYLSEFDYSWADTPCSAKLFHPICEMTKEERIVLSKK